MAQSPAAGRATPIATATRSPRDGCLVDAVVLPMHDPSRERAVAQRAEAIAWQDGRIVAVGSRSTVEAEARRRGLAVHSAGGRLVVPGFVDAHMHFLHVGVKKTRPDLRGAASREEARDRLVAWLRAHPGPEAVIAEGWDESEWPEGHRARLSRQELDAWVALADSAGRPSGRQGPGEGGARGDHPLAPEAKAGPRPVVLRRICGHVAVANSAALPAVRARWDSDDLVELASGVLLEQPSLYLNEVFPTPAPVLETALAHACAEAQELGVTTLGDYSQAPYRAAILRAAASGSLGVRIASCLYAQQFDEAVRTEGFATGRVRGPLLRDGGLKLFLDGSLGARTAALRQPYLDGLGAAGAGGGSPAPGHAVAGAHPGHSGNSAPSRFGCVGHPHPAGTLNWSDAQVVEWMRKALAAGVAVHAHCIGDAAIDQALWGFGQLPRGSLRHRLEHFEIVHPDQEDVTARLGLVASSQPNFVGEWSSKGGMYEARLGSRFALNNRFQSFHARGIPVAFGSDGMPFGPLNGIASAVHHPVPSERLSPEEAVWHYTWASAWSLHWDDDVGSLAPGKSADLVVLDGAVRESAAKAGTVPKARDSPSRTDANPELMDPKQWRIHTTILDGATRYSVV